jgi:hypothetical protein
MRGTAPIYSFGFWLYPALAWLEVMRPQGSHQAAWDKTSGLEIRNWRMGLRGLGLILQSLTSGLESSGGKN